MSLDPSADPRPSEPPPGEPLPADPLPAGADDGPGPRRSPRDDAPRRARRDADRFPRDPQVPGSTGGAVVWVAVALIVALLVAAGFWPAQMSSAAGAAMQWVTTTG
ncbi:MAG: glycine/betaine ABC transporter permease, partial [Brachybacterium tyrofermentans]